MLFNSIQFMIFFPIIVLLYFVVPHRFRNILLLIASYYFYMCWNAKYALLLAFSTLVTYFVGRLIGMISIDEEDRQRIVLRKIFVGIGFAINLSILFFFKYTDFLVSNINVILDNLGIQVVTVPFDIVLPVGISFYIFQALGYTMDVYRGKVPVEKNIIKYAVFVSFFPQLVAGPIERSSNLLKQFSEKHYFEYQRVKDGLLMMAWGLFQKIIVADRIAIMVDKVYNYPQYYQGFEIIFATILFAFQVYCDFEGYSNIAIGASQVMGFELMKNFDCPYFSRTVADFWRRWHISLTTWFRDYLYFPLGGSKCEKKKNYRNIMIVFLVSGLWHGANWTFIIWGGLNGLYQVIGKMSMKIRVWACKVMEIDVNAFSHKVLQWIVTFILVDFAWIFFRANDIKVAFTIVKRMFYEFNPWVLFNGELYNLGLNRLEFWITMLGIIILLSVDYLHYKKIRIRAILARQGIWFRWLTYTAVIFSLLIFGTYGPNYDASAFIYFQF